MSQLRGLAAAARTTSPGDPPAHVAPRCPAAAPAVTYARVMLGGAGGTNLLSPSFDGELNLLAAVEAATLCSRGCNPINTIIEAAALW